MGMCLFDAARLCQPLLLVFLSSVHPQDLVAEVPAAKELFDKASDILGYDLLKVSPVQQVQQQQQQQQPAHLCPGVARAEFICMLVWVNLVMAFGCTAQKSTAAGYLQAGDIPVTSR